MNPEKELFNPIGEDREKKSPTLEILEQTQEGATIEFKSLNLTTENPISPADSNKSSPYIRAHFAVTFANAQIMYDRLSHL